jgi:DinB superfamily
LRSLVLEDWQRIGIHEEWGPITLLAVLTFFIEHEEEHCAQIVAINNARS